MRYRFDDDQRAFAAALRDVLKDRCPAEVVRGGAACESTVHDQLWQQLGRLGALDLLASQQAEGPSFDEVTLVLLYEEAGYAALPAPFVEHAGVAVPAVAEAGVDIERFVAGDARLVCALPGQGPVGWAQPADAAVVQNDSGELALVEGSELRWQPVDRPLDPSRPIWQLCGIASQGLVLGPPEAVGLAFDRGVLGAAAQLIGLGQRMCDMSVAHVCNREQFGVPVGSFQAVKHQLADAATALEYARPLVHAAAWSVAQRTDPARSMRVSMGKVVASEAALTVGRVAPVSRRIGILRRIRPAAVPEAGMGAGIQLGWGRPASDPGEYAFGDNGQWR